jgi:hypothetical protein
MEEIEQYIERASKCRGEVITATIMFEESMSDFISAYFSNNNLKKKKLLSTLLINSLSFRDKADILTRILDHQFPTKKIGDKSLSDINSNVRRIAKERNIFAHESLVVNNSKVTLKFLSKYAVCFKRKDARRIRCYSWDEVADVMDIITNVMKDILAMNKILFRRSSPLRKK